MIWSSLNRLFLTTPSLALTGHPKWEKSLFLWATLGEQVNSCHLRSQQQLTDQLKDFLLSSPLHGALTLEELDGYFAALIVAYGQDLTDALGGKMLEVLAEHEVRHPSASPSPHGRHRHFMQKSHSCAGTQVFCGLFCNVEKSVMWSCSAVSELCGVRRQVSPHY